jgi:hypothetical protein
MDWFFGRKPPVRSDDTVPVHWGARAIFKRGVIDILYDRQQMIAGDEQERMNLAAWINASMPKLEKLVKRMNGSESTVVEFDDGGYHMEASPQSSYGYLYIGAWKT